MADDVRLTDLEVIQRYSIAVRGEKADRADLVAALKADLAWLEGGTARRTAKTAKPVAKPAAAKPAAAKPVAKPAAKPAPKPAAKPAAGRRASR